MAYAFLVLSLIVFAACWRLLKIVDTARAIVGEARSAMAVIQSVEIDDGQKEKLIRSAGARMFTAFLNMSARSIASVMLPAAVVYSGVLVGLYTLAGAASAASNWIFVVLATVFSVGILLRWT